MRGTSAPPALRALTRAAPAPRRRCGCGGPPKTRPHRSPHQTRRHQSLARFAQLSIAVVRQVVPPGVGLRTDFAQLADSTCRTSCPPTLGFPCVQIVEGPHSPISLPSWAGRVVRAGGWVSACAELPSPARQKMSGAFCGRRRTASWKTRQCAGERVAARAARQSVERSSQSILLVTPHLAPR